MRLFGFRVHVRPGFFVFMLLIVMVNRLEVGLWLAGAITAFTLTHELGHAFAARATGARAEISLDFMAGYASFQPTRPLRRIERAGIALAGPASQIVLGIAVLVAMGIDPLARPDVSASSAAIAIWWAGPALGAFNLLPVLPLDGGTIAAEALDLVAPGRGRRLVTTLSLPVTLIALVALVSSDSGRPFAAFAAILLVLQLQALSADRQQDPAVRTRELARAQEIAARAEARQWSTGRIAPMSAGQVPSPWWRSHELLAAGDADGARALISADLASSAAFGAGAGWWWPPDAAPLGSLAAVRALLPVPMPRGNRFAERVLVDVLRRLGEHEEAARYGADSFARSPTAAGAVAVARSVAALGDHDLAVRWLHTARGAQHPGETLAQMIDAAPELAAICGRPDVQALRREPA